MKSVTPTLKTIKNALVLSVALVSFNGLYAGTTYNITSDNSWSSVIPATCSSCTINISTGVLLTIDESVTCKQCFFSGGALSMNSQTLSLQTGTTFFQNL